MLVKYIKNDLGEYLGCIVAIKKDNQIRLGWSQRNKKDKFEKSRARAIATARAELGGTNARPTEKLRLLFEGEINSMAARASRYFKDANL